MLYYMRELCVEYMGRTTYLNAAMVQQQRLQRDQVKALLDSHKLRLKIFHQMELTNNVALLRLLAEQFDELEFRQQVLWGFRPDPHLHRWWTVPKCLCPKSINEELWYDTRLNGGPSDRYFDSECPIHGEGFEITVIAS